MNNYKMNNYKMNNYKMNKINYSYDVDSTNDINSNQWLFIFADLELVKSQDIIFYSSRHWLVTYFGG